MRKAKTTSPALKAAREKNWRIHQLKMLQVVARQNISNNARLATVLQIISLELGELYA